MKPDRARIINTDYRYEGVGDRLVIVRHATTPKPWQVAVDFTTRRFPTHAEAITWANKQVTKARRKGKRK